MTEQVPLVDRPSIEVLELQQTLNREASRSKVQRLLKMAIKYGVIVAGWTAAEYMGNAVVNFGWESTAITGPKGTAKSNLLLQRGFHIYKSWELARKYTITEIPPFLDLLEEAIENQERIKWLGVDDIATIFPKSLYFTNRKLYSELQSSWETLRTVCSNFDYTATRKNKVASFITSDITGDIITYNRVGDIISHYDYRRWLWLRNPKDPTEMIAKLIAVEDIPFPLTPDAFKVSPILKNGEFISGGVARKGEAFFRTKAKLNGIPRDEFKKYWDNRLRLASNAYHKFKSILEKSKIRTKQKELMSKDDRSAVNRKNIMKRWKNKESS